MRNGTPFMLSQRFMSTDLTYNPADGLVYGCFTNDAADGYEFGTVDFAEGERTTISALPAAWNAIAADKSGNMFVIDMEGDLLKVDKSNGSVTRIGATGYVPQNLSSATFDHKTGKLYWTVSPKTERRSNSLTSLMPKRSMRFMSCLRQPRTVLPPPRQT